MNGDDWALLLSVVGFAMSTVGLVLAVRAIWDETYRRDLRPRWRVTLEATQTRVRQVLGRSKDAHVMTGTARGSWSFTASAVGVSDAVTVELQPQTLDSLRAHVDREITKVREAITAQANDAASRIDALNERVTDGLAGVSARLEDAEQVAAEIDAHTLDREVWGLLWVAGGSLLQAVAMFVDK